MVAEIGPDTQPQLRQSVEPTTTVKFSNSEKVHVGRAASWADTKHTGRRLVHMEPSVCRTWRHGGYDARAHAEAITSVVGQPKAVFKLP